MTNITSMNYNNEEVKFNYYVDKNDIWWYDYETICEYLEFDRCIANSMYKHKITDNDKKICYDDNNEYKEYVERKFISSNAVRCLVNRNNMRNRKLIKAMNNIEFVGDAYDLYEDAVELKDRINLLNEGIKLDDYEEIVYQSYEITNSKSGRDILDKIGTIKKEKEDIIDDFRYEIYDDDVEEINYAIVKKRNVKESERIEILYRKNSENDKESTCPPWIKLLF